MGIWLPWWAWVLMGLFFTVAGGIGIGVWFMVWWASVHEATERECGEVD